MTRTAPDSVPSRVKRILRTIAPLTTRQLTLAMDDLWGVDVSRSCVAGTVRDLSRRGVLVAVPPGPRGQNTRHARLAWRLA